MLVLFVRLESGLYGGELISCLWSKRYIPVKTSVNLYFFFFRFILFVNGSFKSGMFLNPSLCIFRECAFLKFLNRASEELSSGQFIRNFICLGLDFKFT